MSRLPIVKIAVSTRGERDGKLNATVAGCEQTGRRALLHSIPLSLFVMAFALAGSLNGFAEPQQSETPGPVAPVASGSEQTVAMSEAAMNKMTAEVINSHHWPAWNSDRLSYSPLYVNFLTQTEVNDAKFLFVPLRLLTSDGDVTWSCFQAGYGKPFSRESLFLSKSRTHLEDPQNVLYVKITRAF